MTKILPTMINMLGSVERSGARITKWKVTRTEVILLGEETDNPNLLHNLIAGYGANVFGAKLILR